MKTLVKGFTLIEMMIIGAILGILFVVLKGAIEADDKRGIKTWGATTGMSQPRTPSTNECVSGYVVLNNGNQLLDNTGHGVRC